MDRRLLVIVPFLVALVALLAVLMGPDRQLPADPAATEARQSATAGPGGVAREIVHARAEALLREGRPWRAAQLLRDHLEARGDATPTELLLAARAEAGWGGWDRVRALLEGADWLDREGDGYGHFLLGRALEADGDWAGATAAYRRFLATPAAALGGDEVRVAEIRGALAALRGGESAAGLEMLGRVRGSEGQIAPRLDLLAAEAFARRGDTAAVRRLTAGLQASPLAERAGRARVQAAWEAGDFAGVRRMAEALQGSGADAARAEHALFAGRAALRLGDRGGAAARLRSAVALAPRARAALDAALELESLGPPSAGDRLAIARVYDQHGRNRQAVEHYRAWLAGGGGSRDEQSQVRLSLGRALFDLDSFAEAEAALRPLAAASGEAAAEALFLIGRAQFRAGRTPVARDTYLRVAERFPRTQPGAEALYLVADMHHHAGETAAARRIYRRVADEFPARDRAGLALMRLAGMAYLEGDRAGAGRVWDEYRSRYPRGQLWLQATYWAARVQEDLGDRAAALERYRAVRARDPMSFYALRAAERSDAEFWPVPMGPEPRLDPAGAARVAGWMRAIDLLRDAGLYDEADAEALARVAAAGTDPNLAYPLAEALNERGYTVRGIRLGLQLQGREGRVNPRLLRILYPFPYRNVIEAEARELELDPLLSAALIRQESMFSARISSPVGARGLMQIMPQTGRAVAGSLGIENWDDELLFQPEINVHLGTRYLSDQMKAYGGSLPSVFSAYNAGPHRVDEWRRYPEYGDEELFTERIPFRETRDYVKILTRNLAVYRGLYGDGG
jgi:soluble lytic murein transglycosylase